VSAISTSGWLRERLARPARRLSLRELADSFFHGTITVEIGLSSRRRLDLRLPGRLRGALGRVLLRSASAAARDQQPCPWTPPCALDVLMGRHGEAESGIAIPPPWLLRVARNELGLTVSLTVIGFATDWIEVAAEALVTALREGDVLGPGSSLEPTSRVTTMHDGIAVPESATRALLTFETPLSLRSGPSGTAGSGSLLPSLFRRLNGLARWQDAELVTEERRAIAAILPGSAVHRLDREPPEGWFRRSMRQQRTLPVDTVGRPVLLLTGPNVPLVLPALTLGELCHAGARPSLGLGRYRLEVGQH
jgi:hypothetical protein